MKNFMKDLNSIFNDNSDPKKRFVKRFTVDTLGGAAGALFMADGVVATGGFGVLPPTPSGAVIAALVTGSMMIGGIVTDVFTNYLKDEKKEVPAKTASSRSPALR